MLAPKLGLLAHPGNHRTHNHPTPLVGGVAIYFGIVFGVLAFFPKSIDLLPALTFLFVVGVIDDQRELPSWLRLLAQAIAAHLMIYFTGVHLETLGPVFSATPYELGKLEMPMTLFATIGVINAINMSDGLDGLVGSLTVLISLSLLVLLGGITNSDIAIMLSAACAGFLVWNLRLFRPQARIFLGDAGSTLIGLLLAFLLISNSQGESSSLQPVMALWMIALPLWDAVALLIIRPMQGRSPFSSDRMHYHHFIQSLGLGVNQTLGVILLLQTGLILLGFQMQKMGVTDQTQLMVFLAGFAVYVIVMWSWLRSSKADIH